MRTDPPTPPTAVPGPFDPPVTAGRGDPREPVFRTRYPDGTSGWVAVGYPAIRAILADPRFSARSELRRNPYQDAPAEPARPGMFIAMDPPDHTRYRRLLTGQFTVRRMRRLTDRVERIAEEHLDRLAAAGPPADLVPAYTAPVPALVICELLGVPAGYRDHFQREVARMSRRDITAPDRRRAVDDIAAYLRDLVRDKRAAPTDDVLGGLVADAGHLTDEELANLAFLLLGAGFDTTANVLALGAFALLTHPGQIPAITDPARIDAAVEELLRYLPVVPGTVRVALEDVEVAGVRIAAGETVLLSLPGGNRDPGRYADPETLDLGRAAGGHLAFGHGVHQCLGQQLARVELRVAFPALFRRFPGLRLAVPPEQVPLRSDMVIHGVHALPVTWTGG
ncbi:cytochrome P450 [Streptantibioticus cattleyicolor]|uniref:Putative cytochrome P450 n=1 Tax=Streptantibioticus cattleyicolor (strain ATCC 35852 / DSM 46488 / JCM 4925 / NBRC 14057 / NRRL 8057) TaxID=1003195 RepID=F8JJX2_STREN|nr:cytochrome P450 [Streptantibioticus cattleyicolor]AEW98599.1 putative cytochrome P450 [Streptantibioticus cattleyicolor NRRL 8057 = DSM 46488]CCB72343.1 Cytochrome P450 105C1 [Streptantibioticus cattleyicolor NRRL 8057 = DSM 46488]